MPTRRVGLLGCCVVLRPHGCCGRRVCCPAGRAAWCARGRRSFCLLFVARQISGRRVPARPRRELRSARRLVVGPGPANSRGHRSQAPPSPSHLWGWVCWRVAGCVGSLLGQAPRTCVGTAARPRFGPTGPASALAHIAAELLNFACNSPTTLSNYEFTTLELQRFQTLLKLHPIELHASFLRGGRMGAAGGAAGAREPGVWLSETAVAFARAGRASVETAAAFAGEKWVYFVRFSVASVLSVSMVAVEGRAVVMAVSRWPAPAAAVVPVVTSLPRCRVLCAKKFALRGLMWA